LTCRLSLCWSISLLEPYSVSLTRPCFSFYILHIKSAQRWRVSKNLFFLLRIWLVT
jgi:hypothetical protein